MSSGFGLMIESLVAILLLLTICYCVVLNRRLKTLKADEQSLKATISELITATEIAERAIAGLKLTVRDCDKDLGEQLRSAERLSGLLGRQIEAGEGVVSKLVQIVGAAKPAQAPPAIAADAQATVSAAQAFAARMRQRAGSVAA
ncbi:MAG: DUF6468 domain-containing protein [Xanthobacteraceae bacterium]|nr:DUF6468 domain-containing protein [Xanthobacteraceae bacterium]